MSDFKKIRRDLSSKIGFDVAYITANDEAYHLDAPGLLYSFAGLLIASYCAGFVEAAVKDFKHLGEASWGIVKENFQKLAKKAPRQKVDKEQEMAEEQVFLIFQEIFISLKRDGHAVDIYSRQAQSYAAALSRKHNFPEDKANSIAAEVERRIVNQLKERR